MCKRVRRTLTKVGSPHKPHPAPFWCHHIVPTERVGGMGIVGGSPYGCQILPNSGYTCGTPVHAGFFYSNFVRFSLFFICLCTLADHATALGGSYLVVTIYRRPVGGWRRRKARNLTLLGWWFYTGLGRQLAMAKIQRHLPRVSGGP